MTDGGDILLLTGLPSFAARKTCEALLDDEADSRIFALVRERDQELFAAFVAELEPSHRARIEPLTGDPSSIDLGLSGEEWKMLCERVVRIHHVAGTSQLGMSREEAEREHLASTREVLELASNARRLRCLVHHSSASVSGTRTGRVLESELSAGQSFRNVVEEVQARAENLVRKAASKLPVVVVRPTLVFGDSRTGEADPFEGPYFLVLLLLTSPREIALPLLGRGELPLHLVPADYVARASVRLGRDPRAIGRTFHLRDPSPPTARRVFELVASAGGRRAPRGHIPANLTKALLRAPGLERLAQSPLAFLDALLTPVDYDSRNADELLAGTNLDCPPFETYVERIVEAAQSRLRERRDRRSNEVPETLS